MDYFILKPDGEQLGTYSIDQIRAMLNSGFVGPDTCYWHEGIAEWQPIERIEESLNFPALAGDREKALPPPRRLSGSLARAIPSPQQKRLQEPTPTIIVPGPPAEAVPVFGPMEAPPIPAPTKTPYLNGHAATIANGAAAAYETVVSPAGEPTALPPATAMPSRRWWQWRPPVSARYWFYAGPAVLVALAIIGAIVASRHPARSPLSRVTLTTKNVYVLLDQGSIKSFEGDMRTSPVAASLASQVAQSTDEAFIQRMAVGLQRENVQHSAEVTQRYILAGKAKFIEPGTYNALSYFDDSGAITEPKAGEPWVAIPYKGAVVFAYQGTEFVLKPQ